MGKGSFRFGISGLILSLFLSACGDVYPGSLSSETEAPSTSSSSNGSASNTLTQYTTTEVIPVSAEASFKLSNGKVISISSLYKTVSIVDPKGAFNQKLTRLNDLKKSYIRASMALLPDERVLIAGGGSNSPANWTGTVDVEIYDPNANSGKGNSVIAAPLQIARILPTLTVLPSGKVLIMGGNTAWGDSSWHNSVELYDPTGLGSSTLMNPMSHARLGHTATLLPNGKILVIAGTTVGTEVELYDPDANAGKGASTDLTPLSYSRNYSGSTWGATSFSSTLLPNGKVLIIGGLYTPDETQREGSVELYDPAGTGSSTLLPPLIEWKRNSHSATLLSSGQILVAGGFDPWHSSSQQKVELYDPTGGGTSVALNDLPRPRSLFFSATLLDHDQIMLSGSEFPVVDFYDPAANGGLGGSPFPQPTPLSEGRKLHTSTALLDGRVLVVGGKASDQATGGMTSVELYDPETNAIKTLNPISGGKFSHTSSLLPNGEVLIVGGGGSQGVATDQVILYNASGSGTSRILSGLNVKRIYHQAIALSSGKVLISGGYDENWGALDSVELYDPSGSGTSTLLNPMSMKRAEHSAHLLSNGKVLLMSGYGNSHVGSVELYDPTGSGATAPLADMIHPRTYFTAQLLPNGKIIAFGGYDVDGYNTTAVELYDPSGSGSSVDMAPLLVDRIYHSCALLENGKILISGGMAGDQDNPISSLEIYDPNANSGSGAASFLDHELLFGIQQQSATLLKDGRVWLYGGSSAGNVAPDGWSLYQP